MSNEILRKYPLVLDLQTFAEPNDPPQDPPADPPADPKDPPKDPPKTFTQEELDEIVRQRLERERKKYGDYDDVKSKLSEFEKAEEERKKAAMSEQERLEAEKTEALRKAEEAEGKARQTIDAANGRLKKAEFKLEAKAAGIRADALDDAFILADLSAVDVDEEGNVKGVKEAVTALLTAKPYLVEAPRKEPRNIGEPNNPPISDEVKTLEQQLEDAKKKKDFSKVIELSNKIKSILGK